MMMRYSDGMFILMRSTDEQKYMPMIWARIKTMMFEDFDDEIL